MAKLDIHIPHLIDGDGLYPDKCTNRKLYFSALGYQTQTLGFKVKNNQTNTVDIALAPNGGTVDGTVTDAITTVSTLGATVNIYQERN